MHSIYLVHHDQPKLLEIQAALLRKWFPDSEIIAALSTPIYRGEESAYEMLRVAGEKVDRTLESDTGRTRFGKLVQVYARRKPFRPIILRIPILRRTIGQDPSSGHARLLNRIMLDILHLKDQTEVWIIEGDVFPVRKPIRLAFNYQLSATFNKICYKGKILCHLQPRVVQLLVNSFTREWIRTGLLDWSPMHGYRYWFDTGAKTHTLLALLQREKSIGYRLMTSDASGTWDEKSPTFKSIEKEDLRRLLLQDPRRGGTGPIVFDFYDQTWLHIGKVSGYFDGQGTDMNSKLSDLVAECFGQLS